MCVEKAFLWLETKSFAFKSFPYPLFRRLCGYRFSFLVFFLITHLFPFKFIFKFLSFVFFLLFVFFF